MPKLSDMMPSNSAYLKKEDVANPQLVTIRDFTMENLAMSGQPEEKKAIVHFMELEKGLVLNMTNRLVLEDIFKTENTEPMIGKKIVLFNDLSVTFIKDGKLEKGGIRIRAPRLPAAPAPAPVPPPAPQPPQYAPGEDPDDVPFN